MEEDSSGERSRRSLLRWSGDDGVIILRFYHQSRNDKTMKEMESKFRIFPKTQQRAFVTLKDSTISYIFHPAQLARYERGVPDGLDRGKERKSVSSTKQ
mmetsp:Transcript_22739/g.47993  ORF Transcript_22739/g.47993 Transcript_22739/m.47993 type:complete len:99 (+) Transcript_22739:603-899(+)